MRKISIISIIGLVLIAFFISTYSFSKSLASTIDQESISINLNGYERDLDPSVIDLLKQELTKKSSLGTEFVIGSLRVEKDWGLGTIVPKDMTNLKIIQENHVSEFQVNNSFSFVFVKHNGNWSAGIDETYNITDILNLIPDDKLSANTKKALFTNSKVNTDQILGQQYQNYKFPFAVNNSFKFFRVPKVWHSSGDKAIDFGQDKDVNILATAPGLITDVCKNNNGKQVWIKIKTEDPNNIGTYLNSEELWYMHFDKDTIPANIVVGSAVERGQILGKLVESGNELSFPCPMISTGRHVHILFPYKPFVLDSYTFTTYSNGELKLLDSNNNEIIFNSNTFFHSTQWIMDDNYIIDNDVKVEGNISLINNSIVEIRDNSIVDINFLTNHLEIKNGSKFLIKSGSKIQ